MRNRAVPGGLCIIFHPTQDSACGSVLGYHDAAPTALDFRGSYSTDKDETGQDWSAGVRNRAVPGGLRIIFHPTQDSACGSVLGYHDAAPTALDFRGSYSTDKDETGQDWSAGVRNRAVPGGLCIIFYPTQDSACGSVLGYHDAAPTALDFRGSYSTDKDETGQDWSAGVRNRAVPGGLRIIFHPTQDSACGSVLGYHDAAPTALDFRGSYSTDKDETGYSHRV